MNARITTDPTLPRPSWSDPALRPDLVKTEAVSLVKYIGGGKLTFGQYANAAMAILASEELVWIDMGNGVLRSEDGRLLIEPVKV